MSRILFSLILAAVGLVPAASAQLTHEPEEEVYFAVPLPEVLEGYYEAIGGLEAWEALTTIKMTGSIKLGPGLEAPFTMYQKRPDKLRLDFSAQGAPGVQAFDGTEGWMIPPGQTQAEAMPEEMLEQFREQADIEGPLVGYQDKGHEALVVGEEPMMGRPCYKLQVKLASGAERFFYLDREEYRIVTMTGTIEDGETASPFTVNFSEYEKVGDDKLLIPHRIESRRLGAPGANIITFETVELGVDMPDALFGRGSGLAERAPGPEASGG